MFSAGSQYIALLLLFLSEIEKVGVIQFILSLRVTFHVDRELL